MIDAKNIVADAEYIAPKLKNSLESALPSHHVKVSANKDSIVVALWGYNPTNGIPMNSPSYMKFIMHLTDGSGRIVDTEKVSFESLVMGHELKKAGVKYRKISAKSLLDAAAKMVEWVEKNAEAIKSVEKGA